MVFKEVVRSDTNMTSFVKDIHDNINRHRQHNIYLPFKYFKSITGAALNSHNVTFTDNENGESFDITLYKIDIQMVVDDKVNGVFTEKEYDDIGLGVSVSDAIRYYYYTHKDLIFKDNKNEKQIKRVILNSLKENIDEIDTKYPLLVNKKLYNLSNKNSMNAKEFYSSIILTNNMRDMYDNPVDNLIYKDIIVDLIEYHLFRTVPEYNDNFTNIIDLEETLSLPEAIKMYCDFEKNPGTKEIYNIITKELSPKEQEDIKKYEPFTLSRLGENIPVNYPIHALRTIQVNTWHDRIMQNISYYVQRRYQIKTVDRLKHMEKSKEIFINFDDVRRLSPSYNFTKDKTKSKKRQAINEEIRKGIQEHNAKD